MSNKETLIEFGKVAAIGLLGFIAIIAACGVWNGVALGAINAFYGWVAGINLIAEGFGVYSLYKHLFTKKDKTV